MENVRARIRRGGKILSIICKVIRIFLIVGMVMSFIAAVGYSLNLDFMKTVKITSEGNNIFLMLSEVAGLKEMDGHFRTAIGCMILFLSLLVLYFYVNVAQRLMADLARGQQPFTMEMAKRIRKSAYWLLLLLLYDPVMGIIIFLVALLVSYLVEYGAYLREKAEETNRIQEEMIVSFAEITENKSRQTGQHVKRVSEYARILAEEMGLSETQTENVRIASTMHDVGKLLVSSEILEKPARLTDEEYAQIKKHTTYGGQLLDHVEGDVMALARQIALQHHERVDGRGYPEALSGENISIEGRIVAVADVYDALTSRRSYKDAWNEREAYDEIVKGGGTQFDASVVEAFQHAYEKIDAVRREYADQ